MLTTKVLVQLSMSVDIRTEQWPHDMDQQVLNEIVHRSVLEQIGANLSPAAVDCWVDDYQLHETFKEK